MYYAHFGLKQPPFKITPNTEFFFSGGNRGAVLDALIYAITSGEGIIKVVGEVGSGKTMLCRMLQHLLPEKVDSVYLANPSVAPEDILHAIAFELQLALPPAADRLQVMHELQRYLLERHAAGKQVVIFVEEAQGMPLATLEEIRLLSNLETKHDKLLQIVLFGQPELDVNLNETRIRQLRERITHSFNLGPLQENEIGEYLIFRLRAAGYFGPHLFSKSAIRMIAKSAEGLVRRVNILADKALLATFSDNAYQVTPRQVRAAIKDSEFGAEQTRRKSHLRLYYGAILMVIVGLAAGAILNQWFSRKPVKTIEKSAQSSLIAPVKVSPVAVEVAQSAVAVNQANAPLLNTASLSPQLPVTQTPAASVAKSMTAVAAPIVEIKSADTKTTETKVTQPEPRDKQDQDILERRLAATKMWLHQEDGSTVTIQLMGGNNDDQLRNQLTSLATQVALDNIYVYRTKEGGRPFVTVLYGSYRNWNAAAQAIQTLPKALRTNRPQLRTVHGVLEETKQLQ